MVVHLQRQPDVVIEDVRIVDPLRKVRVGRRTAFEGKERLVACALDDLLADEADVPREVPRALADRGREVRREDRIAERAELPAAEGRVGRADEVVPLQRVGPESAQVEPQAVREIVPVGSVEVDSA